MAPKKQQQKMALGDFLSDQSLGSWADEMDNMPMPAPSGFGSRSGGASGSGPGSSGGWGSGNRAEAGASRPEFGGTSRLQGYAVREELPLPDKPPYTAHLGNLSFEVTEADVQDFLSGCEVTSVRIIEDKMDRRPKGFGYVEFGTVEGLKKALTLSETQFQGRNIRISVADPQKDREPQRVIDDWSRKGPLPDLPGQGGSMRGGPARGGSFRGGFEGGASDAGDDRGARRGFGNFEGDGKVRDFGNWERKGPLTPSEPTAPRGDSIRGGDAAREGRPARAEGGFRERQAGWGEGTGRTAEDSESRPRREFSERPPPVERAPTAADLDNKWRTNMRPDAPTPPESTPDATTPTSPSAAPAAPASRPRLNLAKRTVSEAPANNAEAGASDSGKASIFGAARPIDSAAREREIEEKRQLAIRAKKEQQDKERDERRASAAAGKESSKDIRKESVTSPTERPAREPKQNNKNADENKDESPAPSAKYEILRRDENTNDMDGDAEEADAQGTIIGDTATKPQEVTREAPAKAQSSWRKSSAAENKADQQPSTTAETLEDDGWSTVSKKEKTFNKRGGGNAGGRAMAS